MRVEEAVQIRTTEIESTAQPSRGYLVVHVPASVRAPHMADGRYYGRGDKTNRLLSNTEVVRLLDRRPAARSDLCSEAALYAPTSSARTPRCLWPSPTRSAPPKNCSSP